MVKHWSFLKFWKHTWPDLRENLVSSSEILSAYSEKAILPERKNWFRALEMVKPQDVKVVILGQDPYPTKGHAHGLAFSAMPHVKPIPKSLQNIFSEYEEDLGYRRPGSGDLTHWAQNGVLLLNTILTVEEGKPLSHAGMGWEKLTYEIIKDLDFSDVVFILWGKKAQEYEGAIETCPIIKAAHPSSRNNFKGGFFGHKPFSRANEHLKAMGRTPVDWRLP